MDLKRIGELLRPFLGPSALTETQLRQFSTYLDLLLRWNSRVNLTAVREPEAVITRHFGESLFAARQLFPAQLGREPETRLRLIDFGSGAGFPGLPIKIWAPQVELQLIESNQKKATFLREVIRALGFDFAEVFSGRAEDFPNKADMVTLRAVEKFELALPVAVSLASSGGPVALLIGEGQVANTKAIARGLQWQPPIPIPLSSERIVLIGVKEPS